MAASDDAQAPDEAAKDDSTEPPESTDAVETPAPEEPKPKQPHKKLGDLPGVSSIPGIEGLQLPGGMGIKDLPILNVKTDKSDPLGRLKKLVGYTVTAVWAVTFVGNILLGRHDSTALLAVQALMMMVAGAIYADNLRGKD